MNILLICKLADHTLKENVLLPLTNCSYVDRIYVLRDKKVELESNKVFFICPQKSPNSKWRHLSKFFRGFIAIYKYRIDAIVGVLNTPHGFIGRTIGLLTNTPYIHMTIAGHREFWVDGHLMEKINLWIIGSAKAITVTGKQTEHYLEQKGINKNKIFIMPNLPNESFTNVDQIESRHYDIISLSRIDQNKNLILLIKALALIKKKYQIKVAIVGDGDQLGNIKEAATKEGVENLIDFPGYVSSIPDKIKLLSDSKIFVSCSKGEGFPISLLEAMNCGCVSVSSNVGDVSDVIHNGENGYLFENVDNEAELVNCLEQLLSNNMRISSFRQSAYKIRADISVANNGRIWDNVFRFVVSDL